MSSVGVLFESHAKLKVGEALEYLITLPAPSGTENPSVRIHCLGKVVRLSEASEVAATLERYDFVR